MKLKGVNIGMLPKRTQEAMKKHSTHHTSGHIKIMVAAILQGKTFTEAHKIAMRQVGK
tara:strand:- start:5172 stop:5345 length:174 start_codon:yes stop_codon:yes gene_type:complete